MNGINAGSDISTTEKAIQSASLKYGIYKRIGFRRSFFFARRWLTNP